MLELRYPQKIPRIVLSYKARRDQGFDKYACGGGKPHVQVLSAVHLDNRFLEKPEATAKPKYSLFLVTFIQDNPKP